MRGKRSTARREFDPRAGLRRQRPRRKHAGDRPEDGAISRNEEIRVQTEVLQLLAAGLAAEIADELLQLSNRPRPVPPFRACADGYCIT